jgi:pseudouridine-5'-phosphate glycosidase
MSAAPHTPEQAPAFACSPEVADALSRGQPVVALESTIITHGLPRTPMEMPGDFLDAHAHWDPTVPANLAAARIAEHSVRAHGAVPATVAMIGGQLRVGLDASELELVAREAAPAKLSLRDLGPAAFRRRTGGTTVAATVAASAIAGIRIFATGGIGGVHRHWSSSLDVSADLVAIATHPVCVVSAGAKSLLDLGATLEALEAMGVPVIGYRTSAFPRFTSAPDPALRLAERVESAAEAARLLACHWRIRPSCGALLAQACPERWTVDTAAAESDLAEAMDEARRRGIKGADVTPFLLGTMASGRDGIRIVAANLALLCANAGVAAAVARASA